MKVIYTKHAENKLKRKDVKKFKINKKLIETELARSSNKSKTKYGDFYTIGNLNTNHIIRIIYVIIKPNIKVITFHIARKGRYDEA